MPFVARRRRQFWSADVRYVDDHKLGGRAYVIAVLDNHSRAILSSALTRTQDLASLLSVLYAAVERYGSPEALVTDGGGTFRATQARAVYGALDIAKHEIERGRPWQNYIETHFNVQRRIAYWHFVRAESWPEMVQAHDRFVEDYNAQAHFAHGGRDDGQRSPNGPRRGTGATRRFAQGSGCGRRSTKPAKEPPFRREFRPEAPAKFARETPTLLLYVPMPRVDNDNLWCTLGLTT